MCVVAQQKKNKESHKKTSKKTTKKPQKKKITTAKKKPTSAKRKVTKKKQTAKKSKKKTKKTPPKKKAATKKKTPKKKAPAKKKTKKRIKNAVSNVYNVGQFIRKNTALKVSPSFVEEAKGRIDVFLDEMLPEAERIAKGEDMKTLQEHHLIKVFDFRQPSRNQVISCAECGYSFSVSNHDHTRLTCCPFCGKKRGISKT